MHSSRMRTGRSLTVCCSLLPGGGVLPAGRAGGSPWSGGGLPGPGGFSLLGGCLPGPGGVLPAGGVSLVLGGGVLPAGGFSLVPGGSAWSGGVLPAGGEIGRVVSAWSLGGVLRRPPLCTESQTRVKT